MKKYVFAISTIIISIVSIVFTGLGKEKTMKKSRLLTVNDIQADPSAYKGNITITGVVAGRHPSDPKVFAIIDTKEAKICKQTGCAKFYLQVRYEGNPPKEWDEVNVTGSFIEGGQFFSAKKLKILKHLKF